VLNEYLAGYITESKMRNDARPWDNYEEAYKPMVEKAKSNNLSVIAANAPRRYVNLVSRKGKDQLKSLPKSARRYLAPLPIRTDDAAYLGRFNAIMGDASHSADNNFFEAQCTWDATMAHRIYRHWKKNKKELIFQLNGRFHSDYQQGTVGQLKRLRKKIKVKNISCFSAEDFDAPNWSQYTDMGDFIILSRPSDS
ncbi:MAG: ChaN family lipoprotein, partial [Bacteroidota bacterium]